MTREHPTRRLAPLLLAVLLTGCGISLGSGNTSELFTSIRLLGDPAVDAEMRIEVAYEQRYAVPVTISCFLVRPGHSRRLLGRETLAPNPDSSQEAEPVEGRVAFRFRPDRPGRHVALCNTALDPENSISKRFRVKDQP